MDEKDTIFAPATPRGKSALALVRISGSEAFRIVLRCIKETALFERTPSRYIQIYCAQDPATKKMIDQITAVKYCAPRSFTGENMVEIICHGGQLIVHEISGALIAAGARLAGGGEFTRRALVNGKLDLMKAEAIRGMIESNCDVDLLCAQKLYHGGEVVKTIQIWRDVLIDLLTEIEAFIEFEEEEQQIKSVRKEGNGKITGFLKTIELELKKREKIKLLEEGITVVIAGPANAGKSTLFNTLVGYDRSIVHNEPGTTRDIISENILIKGHGVKLIDSAGIRAGIHEVEREGINRSIKAIERGNILVWVTAADEKLNEEETKVLMKQKNKNPICIINKIDRNNGEDKLKAFRKARIETIGISLKDQINIDLFIEEIKKRVVTISDKTEVPELLLNIRQEEIGNMLYKELKSALEEWDQAEIASNHIKKALSYLDEWFGKTNSEEILDKVFEGFCIGK